MKNVSLKYKIVQLNCKSFDELKKLKDFSLRVPLRLFAFALKVF